MADSFVQVPPDSTGKLIDAASMDVGAFSVLRQRIVLADNGGTATFATILSSGPIGGEGGLVVRNIPSGTQFVTGDINISNTPSVVVATGQLSIAAGTANIGFINNISATVNVAFAGGISLAAGTANIGFLNNISATVIVAGVVSFGAGTNLIGAVSLAAGTANFGTLNNISATVNTGISFVLEKTTNSQVQVGDSLNAAVRVSIVAGGGTGGIAQADNSTFTEGTTNFTPVGGIFNDTAPGTATEGKVGVGRITTNRALHSNLRTDGGVKMDDSVNSSLRVSIVSDLSTTATVQGTVQVQGVLSAGANVASQMPVLVGFLANNSMQTGVASAQAVSAWGDAFGRQVVIVNATSNVPSVSRGPICINISTSATTQLIAAPGAGLSIYITQIAVTNGSGVLGTSYIYAASQTASCVAKLHVAANGGGYVLHYNPPVELIGNVALNARVKPNISELLMNIHFYVGPT